MSSSLPSVPTSPYAPTKNLRRIGLVPFVAVLFAYCAGGPFSLESMISTSGPGLGLLFLLVVPLLFAVPIALATAEMTTLMPVEGGFYRWSRAALGDFWGFQCGWWNWTGTFLMTASYGVAMADYARSTAIPDEPVIWGVLSLFIATFFTLVYISWRAFYRWLTRRLRGDLDAGNSRVIYNATFFALMLIVVFLPIPKTTMRIDLPVKIKRTTDLVHDTPSQPPVK